MFVAEFAADWPYSHPRPGPETNQHYHYMVRGFVERFGHRPLADVGTAEAQVWGLKNLSAVRYVRAMFTDAMQDGLVAANPFAKVKVPRAPRRRRDEHVPGEPEVDALIAHMPTLHGRVAVALGAYVGLRQSEILAARWTELYGRYAETMYVHQQRGRNGALKPIKGKIKERTVDVFRPARAWLDALAGRDARDGGWIPAVSGPSPHIVPLTHSELREQWQAAREATGLRCEFHQLRTFCATWLLEKGCSPIDVAVQLHGHTDPTVVLLYYSLIDKSKALERLRRVVDGDG